MGLEAVQLGLVTRYLTQFDATKTAWENKKFTPPTGGPWFSFFFVPVTSTIATLGPGGDDEENGYAQIDLNWPGLEGEGDITALFEKVRTCFPPASSFIHAGQDISILSVSRAGGREVNGFYRVPVTVRWRAFVTRAS